jgi:alkanesulfonate monooxygenase SsuD/methylene tetrahydromethanopterin reductase-like flavin-dependent oxidoreductase (luciferase family)
MTEIQLGVTVPASADTDPGPVAAARAAEALGFDFVSTSDHPCGTDPTYETWTMLTWIAASTSRIRIATRVLGVPYRSPAMVAKMAETLDRLSGGRLILGLGGGYSDGEFRAFGLRVPTARDKVDGLEEAITITRGLWSQPAYTFAGRIHHVTAADIEPKPSHRIPIWLGTFGDRALAVTGRHADGWIPSLGYVTASQLPAMRGKVLTAALTAGRTAADLTCALNVQIHVGTHTDPRPGLIAGPPAQVTACLLELVTAGFTAFNFMPADGNYSDQMEQIAAHVLPGLRAAA